MPACWRFKRQALRDLGSGILPLPDPYALTHPVGHTADARSTLLPAAQAPAPD